MSRLLRQLLGQHVFMAPETGGEGGSGGGSGGAPATMNPLEMSDEDIAKMDAPPPVAVAQPEGGEGGDGTEGAAGAAGEGGEGGEGGEATETDEEKAAREAEEAAAAAAAAGGDGKDGKKPDAKDPADDPAAGAEGADGKPGKDGAAGADGGKKVEKDPKDPPADDKTQTATAEPSAEDIKAFYDTITAPFKANGREIQVKDPKDAISLMQMGANYNKKMAALKPHLKLLKTLENAKLLNEDQINFVIDVVSKKDKHAISKLVKDSGLDPLELSAEKASEYTPGAHSVSEVEVELDTVLDEIKENSPEVYTRTLELTTKWDTASKQVIAGSPQVLKLIAAHMEAGFYEQITKEVENERLFGRLTGLSDIEAYRQVGDRLNKEGRFNQPARSSSPADRQPAAEKKIVIPTKKPDDKDRNDKRRAASPGRPAGGSSSPLTGVNPLSLSDDEIAKLGSPKFL